MNRHSQKGSALLIVLGFLSFMVVSAVAFAIWMRNERLPSSALRRSVANRFLVKAALAQAMSRVDDAIRSHPYPGAWSTNDTKNGTANVHVRRDGKGIAYDWWESRVFMPPDPEGDGTISGKEESRYAPASKTVSVLNLEALGYLPPALVNDVRLLSRSSWAAQWEYFNFDAGRYAFCAVNVSDMLDINKIAAASPRTSAAAAHPESSGKAPPPSRFSLAYLFRGNDYDFASPSGHGDFDGPTHTSLSDLPLVSLMDYNLAMGKTSAGAIFSPFFYLINGDTKSGGFYGGDKGVRGAKRQLFVTDSWFPRSDYESSRLWRDDGTFRDITSTTKTKGGLKVPCQPFKNGMDNDGKALLRDIVPAMNMDFWNKMQIDTSMFCAVDNYTLFDYLDTDDVPLSLAMPCAERVPMIAAIGPAQKELDVTFEPFSATPREERSGTTKQKIFEAKIIGKFPSLSTTIIYPFKKDGDGRDARSYTAEAFLRLIFIASKPGEGIPLPWRSKVLVEKFHPLQKEWPDLFEEKFKLEAGNGGEFTREAQKGCLLLSQKGSQLYSPEVLAANTPNVVDNNKKVAQSIQLGKTLGFDSVILQKIESVELDEDGNEKPETKKTTYKIPLRAFNVDGSLITDDPEAEITEEKFAEICTYEIRPYLAVWVRLKDGDDTVDMVPASLLDDQVLNGKDNSGGRSPELLGSEAEAPFMRFLSNVTFTYADLQNPTFAEPPDKTWADTSCYAVDPRYNWAPENWLLNVPDFEYVDNKDNWFKLVFKDETGEGSVVQKLAEKEYSGINGWVDRARDPFLFVSNSGYLQSVGELAFLPRVSAIDNTGSGSSSSVLGSEGYNGEPRKLDTVETMPCARAAWKSYQTYRTNPNEGVFELGANLHRRGLVSGAQGFYVNPFTQSDEVMLAALANTPLNYWVAGTNKSVKTVPTTFVNGEKNPLFGDTATSVMTGEDINKIATFLRHRFEDLACMIQMPATPTREDVFVFQKIWEDLFDAMDWGGRLSNDTASYTVKDLYDDLKEYVNGGTGAETTDYKDMYIRKNGYQALNGFVVDKTRVTISFNENDLPHKDELNYEADPLRGQCERGVTQCYNKFHDIDRMFLHSYWRDCFANRQQLFLIFVRAESTALGGTGEGTPAQQGGRAVALVWRDPGAPTPPVSENDDKKVADNVYEHDDKQDWDDNDSKRHPHKMRILFYRQLD